MDRNILEEGDIVVYKKCDDSVQIGKVKRLTDRGAFVWYTTGETASCTPYELLMKVENPYCMETYFGIGM
jgi:hypothetical protein